MGNTRLDILILALAVGTAAGRNVMDSNYAGARDVFMAGAGAIITRNPHKGIGTESRGIPLFFYRKEKLSLYRNSQLNDYYYGVRSSEAIPGRPEYDVCDSIGLLTVLSLNYRLNKRWSVMGMAAIQWLGSEIIDSPIVEKDYMVSMLLGIMCRF